MNKQNSQRDQSVEKWITIAILAIFTYWLGVWGYALLLKPTGGTLFDAAYRCFDLFRMRYEGQGPIPWQLEVARFMAPVVTLMALGKIALSFLRDQWASFKVRRFWARHHVVIGSGEACHTLVSDIAQNGSRVVLVSDSLIDKSNDALWHKNCALLHKAVNDEAVWNAARLDHAASLIVMTNNDESNLDLIRRAKSWSQQNRRSAQGQLHAYCQFADARIRQLLRDRTDFFDPMPQFAASAFNPYQRAARIILRAYPVEGKQSHKGSQPHILLTGDGLMTEHLIIWIAMTGHFPNDTKTRITLCGLNAPAVWERLCRNHPGIVELLEMNFMLEDPERLNAANQLQPEADIAFSAAYFCDSSGAGNLIAANRCAAMLDRCDRVVVLEQYGGLADILKPREMPDQTMLLDDAPKIFSLTTEVYTQDGILQQDLDRYASHVADQYYRHATTEWGMQRGATAAVYPWADLSEEWRDANRTQADHIGIKLRSIDAQEVDSAIADASFTFTCAEIELLAKMEHARWTAQRIMYGWTYAEQRDDKARRHPDIVGWDKLDEKTRQKDRDAVCAIPAGLRLIGRGVRRVEIAIQEIGS